MKYVAVIFSVFILSLTIAPAIQILHAKFSSCENSCSKKTTSDKDADGCDKKTCTVFSCCFKTQVYPPVQYRITNVFQPELVVLHNFKPKKDYISLRSFDIWHPPRFI